MFSVIWVVAAVFCAAVSIVLIYFVRKQKDLIVKTTVEAKTNNDQRDYWFQKHNKLRERILMVASEVKDIELNWVRKKIGTHTACNKLTAIIEKMANDEFRDQYIFSVMEMKEKHAQEGKDRLAQLKLDEARKKMNKIVSETPKLAENE